MCIRNYDIIGPYKIYVTAAAAFLLGNNCYPSIDTIEPNLTSKARKKKLSLCEIVQYVNK